MLDVQQRHAYVSRIVPQHQIPELLGATYVEYVDAAFQGSQQRQEKLEPSTPHSGRERPAIAVVGKRANQRSTGADRRRPRWCRHAGASSSGTVARAAAGTDSPWAIVTVGPANQK